MNKMFDVKISKTRAKRGGITYFTCEWDDLVTEGKRAQVNYALTDNDIVSIKNSGTLTLEKAITSGFLGAIMTTYFVMPPETDEEKELELRLNELKDEVTEAVSESIDIIESSVIENNGENK